MQPNAWVGQKLRATLEMPDGLVYSGVVYVARVFQECEMIDVTTRGSRWAKHIPSPTAWTMDLRGVGELEMTSRNDAMAIIKHNRKSDEWRCDFCGSIMPKARRSCTQCGAFRSFLYEM